MQLVQWIHKIAKANSIMYNVGDETTEFITCPSELTKRILVRNNLHVPRIYHTALFPNNYLDMTPTFSNGI